MTLRQIEYFCAVAEEKSVSAAARALFMEQPPISRQLAALENELGVQLFVRGNRGIVLTEAGQYFYGQCRLLLNNLTTIQNDVRDIGSGISGTLKIGIIFSSVPYAIPYIRNYHEKYPQVKLYIRMGTPHDLLTTLDKGDLNVVILRDNVNHPGNLSSRLLGEDKMALIMTPALDPAPDMDAVPIRKLKDAPLCLLGDNDIWSYDAPLLDELQKHGIEPNIVCTCYDTPMAIQMIRNNFGMSFLPASITLSQSPSEIYAKPIKGLQVKSAVKCIWRNDFFISKCVRLFVQPDKEATQES